MLSDVGSRERGGERRVRSVLDVQSLLFLIKENWFTRYHAESNINILLIKSLPFDSGVRQWSYLLMILLHCIITRLNQTIERVVNLNVTWLGFIFVLFRSFTCMVQLLFHSLLERVWGRGSWKLDTFQARHMWMSLT